MAQGHGGLSPDYVVGQKGPQAQIDMVVERRSEEGGGLEEMWLCYVEADEGYGR